MSLKSDMRKSNQDGIIVQDLHCFLAVAKNDLLDVHTILNISYIDSIAAN